MEASCNERCYMCDYEGLEKFNGYFFCLQCNVRAEDMIDTGVSEEDVVAGGIYMPCHRRKHTNAMEVTPIRQRDPLYDSLPKLFKALGLEDLRPQPPVEDAYSGALTYEDYYNGVRLKYLMGLQVMLQWQCETLIKEFGVSPLLCDFAEKIWLRFVEATNVFSLDWVDIVIHEFEMERAHSEDDGHEQEPQNICGEHAANIWYRSLKKTIPLYCTLAISFLACHLIREAVLPTDITKWVIERKLPYLSAFVDIDKLMGSSDRACPISSMQMFNPSRHVSPQEIESWAANIADSIGLKLPPVNFFEMASRYLRQLQLPHSTILPKAMLVYDWSMPPDLWLFTKKSKVPTCLCVLSILIVAIRMLYNINGFGCWERSLSNKSKEKDTMDLDPKFNDEDTVRLLHHLHSLYTGIPQKYEHTKDLQTYLKYCKDFVFAGLEPDPVEKGAMEQLWDYYQSCCQDDKEPYEPDMPSNPCLTQKEVRDEGCSSSKISKRTIKKIDEKTKCLKIHGLINDDDDEGMNLDDRQKNDEALKILKLDMEEKGFHYIPPRVNIKRFEYIHYVRKKDDGNLAYVAHADYYILLRACAHVAQVDVRIMHMAVLKFEKRLEWIEDQIEKTLCVKPKMIRCEHCRHHYSKE